MRYVIQARGMSLGQIESECHRLGAKNIKVARVSGQIFCDLEEAAAELLKQMPGLAVKLVGKVYTDQIIAQPVPVEAGPTYAGSQASLASAFYQFREAVSPPITGIGSSVAVLDSGVRKTHRALRGKVVYEANFTGSPTAEDIFDHGTGVAFLVAGGRHAPGEESGLAPGASILNIKVLDDSGEGTAENVILGLEHVLEMRQQGLDRGLLETDPLFPNLVNMSFGTEDDGDPDNPIRVACRKSTELGLVIVAAAGNAGPNPGTVVLPAVDPEVAAVGAVTFSPFDVWQSSSRGPTKEGLVKPDLVFYGVAMLIASAVSDDAFVVKSGSSFAAPCLSGAASLLEEIGIRLMGKPLTRDETLAALPLICRKPQGSPAEKDNTYGFGMPMGDLLVRMLKAPAVTGMEAIAPLFGLGLGGIMLSGVLKSLRR